MKVPLYSIAVLGAPTAAQLRSLEKQVRQTIARFRLDVADIEVLVDPVVFKPNPRTSSAAIFYGGLSAVTTDISRVLDAKSIPVLPVASQAKRVSAEIPASLRHLNCVFYRGPGGADRVFGALLECLGMLPRQRRVFLSYRREESTAVALQLFAELSARQHEVFLDTHRIGAGVDFQESLWHSLCDVDVLIMLDTPKYFTSRWTAAEYGRALAQGIGVFRVQWPTAAALTVTGTSSLVKLGANEFRADGCLEPAALDRVCDQLEDFRSLAHATRHLSIVSAVKVAVGSIGARIVGMDAARAIQVQLHSGKQLLVQPVVGVPTSVTLQQTADRAAGLDSAVVYDHSGIRKDWLGHMSWLGGLVKGTRWVKKAEAAYDFSAWDAT